MNFCLKKQLLLATLMATLDLIPSNWASAQTFTNLYNLDGATEGAAPSAWVLSGQTLCGTAGSGGSFGAGVVFKMSTNGQSFTTLHTFTNGTDGNTPAGLILAGTTLYGTTYGKSTQGGTIFSLDTNGNNYFILHLGTNVVLSWSVAGYNLESTTNLAAPVWITVPGQNAVTNPIAGTRKFYRLSQ